MDIRRDFFAAKKSYHELAQNMNLSRRMYIDASFKKVLTRGPAARRGRAVRGVAVEVMVGVARPLDLMCWIFDFIVYFKA